MLNVPSVTMNGGSRSRDQAAPLTTPNAAHAASPIRIASTGGTLDETASLVITIVPKAITAPFDRSIPAVRMISVWPMARRADDHHLLDDQREVRGQSGTGLTAS